MKKKVLFSIRDFAHGGIPKCLQQLLTLIDTSRYEIDLFCADQSGAYKGQMPNCNVIAQDWLLWAFMTNYRKQKGWRLLVVVVIKVMRDMMKKIGFDWYEFHIKKIARGLNKTHYDSCVAYGGDIAPQLCSLIDSRNKLIWVHFDCGGQEIESKEFLPFAAFNHIVAVSMAAKEAFCQRCPSLAHKTIYIHNVLNVEQVKSMALYPMEEQEATLFRNSTFNIISVGRVCAIKRYFLIPQIARELKNRGLDFKWHILGVGPDMETQLVRNNIAKYGVEKHVKLLGAKSNPYPYIKGVDLLVILSACEAFPTVLNEAKAVGTPIVSTNFNAAGEMMDERYGMVVPIEELADGIERMITDKEYYRQIKSNMATFRYDNQNILKQIYEII